MSYKSIPNIVWAAKAAGHDMIERVPSWMTRLALVHIDYLSTKIANATLCTNSALDYVMPSHGVRWFFRSSASSALSFASPSTHFCKAALV